MVCVCMCVTGIFADWTRELFSKLGSMLTNLTENVVQSTR